MSEKENEPEYVSIRTPVLGVIPNEPGRARMREVSIRTPVLGVIIAHGVLADAYLFQSAPPCWG